MKKELPAHKSYIDRTILWCNILTFVGIAIILIDLQINGYILQHVESTWAALQPTTLHWLLKIFLSIVGVAFAILGTKTAYSERLLVVCISIAVLVFGAAGLIPAAISGAVLTLGAIYVGIYSLRN